jgi:biopolymer transport protein ExbB
MNLQQTLLALTQLGATWVLWLLLLLSVLCIAVIAERAACYLQSRGNPETLLGELSRHAQKDDREAMGRLLTESPTFEARVAAAGLNGEPAEAERRMRSAQEAVRLDLEQNLVILGTVGVNAPFVGLLGTVIGIIGAFHELSRTKGLLSETLMAEIGEALVATAVGLLVALPAVIAFNLFRRLVQRRLHQADRLREAVLGIVERRRAA